MVIARPPSLKAERRRKFLALLTHAAALALVSFLSTMTALAFIVHRFFIRSASTRALSS
jgi:hypothetical protein